MSPAPPFCSTVALSVGTIAALASWGLVGIAFSTDNWEHVTVNRFGLQELAVNDTEMQENLEINPDYFDRVRGLFRVCFPSHEDRPKVKELYLNPVEHWCHNIDYYMNILEHGLVPDKITDSGAAWYHLARGTVAAFCLYFGWMALGSLSGLRGCWISSDGHFISTAFMYLFASISGMVGMGLWHTKIYFERERVYDAHLHFMSTWPPALREATTFSFGWSYIISWLGIGLGLLASLIFSGTAICIRTAMREREELMMKVHLSNPYNARLQSYYSAGYPVHTHTYDHIDPEPSLFKRMQRQENEFVEDDGEDERA